MRRVTLVNKVSIPTLSSLNLIKSLCELLQNVQLKIFGSFCTERECLNVLVKRHMGDLMKPHLVVYLDASPEVSAANLKNRGLGEERVWNKEILERVAHHYKYDYLKKISEHAELVAYDWNTPGDGEVMVEDIERIDFDRFSIHDPKMEDWRLKDEWDWAEKRWE